jgi:tRNA(Ile)-lysidine synthase
VSNPTTPRWLARVGRRLERFRGSGVVVAVSGGGDSVGLLWALHALGVDLGLRLSVAHLDHDARGEQSRAEARFVAGLAASLGLPVDLGHWRATRSGHFEAEARRARYDWLAGVARGRGASVVAVGHTLDDQAETILHRVLRGTGLRGLAGIPRSRRLAPGVVLVRPLLDLTRTEIRDHLAAVGQDFREDPSNLDTSRTRARIRLELLPGLADRYNPAVAEALVRLGRLATGSAIALERLAREHARAILLESGPDRVVLDRPGLARLARFERAELLRLAWRRAGWPERGMDARRWRRLAGLATSGRSRTSVGDGVQAEASADRLILTRSPVLPEPSQRDPVELPMPGQVEWAGGRVVATLDGDEPRDEAIDFHRLVPPLRVGPPEPGDRFQPLGLQGSSQSLNHFLRGRKVGRSARGSVPIVRDAEGIVWVVGHRIADRVRLTGATRLALGLRYEMRSSPEKPG